MAALAAGRPNLASRAGAFAAEPDAAHWAEICEWVPGTGHCRNRDCGDACLFRMQQLADAQRVQRWRRLRRIFGRRR